MKVAIICKTHFIANLLGYYLRTSDKTVKVYINTIQNIQCIDENFDSVFLDCSEISGDITEILNDLECMVVNGNKSNIILTSSQNVFYRNNGYTLLPQNGYLESILGLLNNRRYRKNDYMNKEYFSERVEIEPLLNMPLPFFPSKLTKLSATHEKVFKLLLTDMKNQQIADTLFIQLSTTKSHISKIYKILDVNCRSDLQEQYAYLLNESEMALLQPC